MKYVKYGHGKWQPDLRGTASKIVRGTASKIIEETINAITKSLNRIAEQPTWKDIFQIRNILLRERFYGV